MVVLTPEGDEITRIAGGIDMQAYGRVLDAAVALGRPVPELVALAVDGKSLSSSDCRLVAYYSWEQDNEDLLTSQAAGPLYSALEAACPADMRVERTRLFARKLSSLAGLIADIPESDRALYEARLSEILADASLWKADLSFTILEGADVIELVAADPAESELSASWREALIALRHDHAVPKRERIYTLVGELRLQRLQTPGAPPGSRLLEEIMAMASWADTDTDDPYERQTVINAVANTLIEAGLWEEGRRVLLKEREISKYPYYFTLTLAELEMQAGNAPEALGWFREAYREAEGEATRFQWGFNYLVALMDVTPEEEALIRSVSLDIFEELKRNPQSAFYQRTRQRLQVLEERFVEWNAAGDRVESLLEIRASVEDICAAIPADDPSLARCESFLAQI